MPKHLVSSSGLRFPIHPGQWVVGSDPAAEICFEPAFGLVSRHFTLDTRWPKTFLHAGSGARVLVNGLPVTSCDLHDGDLIEAGLLELRFEGEKDAVTSSQPAFVSIKTPPCPASRRQCHQLFFFASLLLLLCGYCAYQGFITPLHRVKAADVIHLDTRILQVVPRRSHMELITTLETKQPIHFPKEACQTAFGTRFLCRAESFGRNGKAARIGLERIPYQGHDSSLLQLISLEVEGASLWTITKHNQHLEATRSNMQHFSLCTFLAALIVLAIGLDKWKALASTTHFSPPDHATKPPHTSFNPRPFGA